MQTVPVPPLPRSLHAPASVQDKKLFEAAQKLEATFLSELLKSANLGGTKGSFSGGIGEEQFSSMLRDEQSIMLVEAGGIGLAESIYNALKVRNDA